MVSIKTRTIVNIFQRCMKITDYRTATHCIYCEREFTSGLIRSMLNKTKDHIIPRSRGGINNPMNYVAACGHCNELKGRSTLMEFAAHITMKMRGVSINDPIRPMYQRMRINAMKLYNKTSQLHRSTPITGKSNIFRIW